MAAVKRTAPRGLRARRFLAGDEEMVIVSFPWPAALDRAAPTLTPAERDVIASVLEGRSYAEIARRRRRAVDTVAKQAGSAFRKLGVGSRSELLARGMLPPRR